MLIYLTCKQQLVLELPRTIILRLPSQMLDFSVCSSQVTV